MHGQCTGAKKYNLLPEVLFFTKMAPATTEVAYGLIEAHTDTTNHLLARALHLLCSKLWYIRTWLGLERLCNLPVLQARMVGRGVLAAREGRVPVMYSPDGW
jgi:hypothetical protein